jgi:hypothetical protein
MLSSSGSPPPSVPYKTGNCARSLLFVHGTGVRTPAYDHALARVQSELHRRIPDLGVYPCCWGDVHGARLLTGSSIPPSDFTRESPYAVADAEEALWYLLYQDPSYELRLIALNHSNSGEFVPGVLSPGEEVDHQVRRLTDLPRLQQLLDPLGGPEFHSHLADAVRAVTEAPEYRDAVAVAEEPLGELRQAIGRAIVAEITRRRLAEPGSTAQLTGESRDRLAYGIAAALGPTERGVAGWIARHLGGVAMGLGATYVQRRRDLLFRAAYPFPGDILLYQSRGQRIRMFVRDCLASLEPPIAVLAHSLGGIIAVDLLVSEQLRDVVKLITVGSQAPFLYEMDALSSLSAGEPLPEHFPDWLNVYDPRDLLGFVAAGPFADRARDVRVDNGQPFPASHGAYWDNEQVWRAVAEHLQLS